MTKTIYIFSGLGADERVFKKLDLTGFKVTFIEWVTPHDQKSMEQYATRLLQQILTPKPILIGLSFGGMMAIEVAKQIDTEKVILLASAKTKKEIPWYYRVAGQMGLHKLLPNGLLKQANPLTNWFGAKSEPDKQILKQILSDTDPIFLKWAINQVVRWKNEAQPENIIHIHGTADKILPFRFVKCDASIQNGGHLMTLNRHVEVSFLLRKYLL